MRQMAILVMSALMVLTAVPGVAADGDEILGLWATEPNPVDGNAHVEISAEGGKFHGRIVWLEKPEYAADDEQGMGGKAKVDRENPDPKLQSRPILSLEIMKGFVYSGKGEWKKGTIYDPENGKTYKCKAKITDEGRLKVRGYIGFSMLGRTSVWTRVASE